MEIVSFLGHHLILTGLLVVGLVWLVIEERAYQGFGGERCTPEAVVALLNRENGLVLDIREAHAYKEGHIAGALNIPASEWERHVAKLEKQKGRPLIVVCAQGQTALKRVSALQAVGYSPVYFLAGGMVNWSRAGLPVVK
ncbi:MAG: hypothetical protein A3J38_08865 [Gammaproteobacteria bacterium RIFCSPHIGHO2_12_FULL_45_9]|nr:MAG: hypothetical protein A3J38_08865 [Gammaproteobacteria bacterium RIFCSPHIGHO2_12_FULL_45_9]